MPRQQIDFTHAIYNNGRMERSSAQTAPLPLSEDQIEQFIRDGFVRLDNAFSWETAEAALEILWRDLPCDRDDRDTWVEPVVRLGGYADAPFRAAANTPRIHAALDQLVGAGRWKPLTGLGTFPVRFPAGTPPSDAGWHVDASFPPAADDPDQSYFNWRINLRSRGRSLLMLFLFSNVSKQDAPTRIRVGSHHDVARILEPAGETGLSFLELAEQLPATEHREEILATGKAGTVYLCHPFLVHSAQEHRGNVPRFMAQPPLESWTAFALERGANDDEYLPVELAVRLGLKR